MPNSWKDHSRTAWSESDENRLPSDERLKIGTLQRIADATEAMAKNHVALTRERDMYERMYRDRQATCERLARQVSALRGVITKLKKRGAR
jgi:hypothetical protein